MFDTERFICEIESHPALYDIKSKEYSNRDVKAKCWVEIAEVMFEDWAECDTKRKDEKVKELMKKWKALRDCFVREHRSVTATGTGQAASKKKKYIFYDHLQFLLPHVKGNSNTSSNIAPSEGPSDLVEKTQMEDELNAMAHEDLPAAEVTAASPPPVNQATSSEKSAAAQPKGTKRKNGKDMNPPTSKRTALEKNILESSKKLTSILASSLEWQRQEQQSDKNGHRAFLLSFLPVLDDMPLSSSMYIRGQISQLFSNYYAQNMTPQHQTTGRSASSISLSNSAQGTPVSTFTDESVEYNISDYLDL